jgi:glycerol uptake facilitator-like aquaporin
MVATIWFIYVFGSVFGDHCNAGVIFAFAVGGKMKTIEVIGYLAAQGIRVLLADSLNRWRWLGSPTASKTFVDMHYSMFAR